jgi:hypothetical protein
MGLIHRILLGTPYHDPVPREPEEPEATPYIPLAPEQQPTLINGVKEITKIAEDVAAGRTPTPEQIAHAEGLVRPADDPCAGGGP